MTERFLLPDLGEGLLEAEIVQWLVAVGDEITLNQPIAEVETAKAIVELPSPFAGVVRALHAGAGDVVPVGEPLIDIAVAGAPESGEVVREDSATPASAPDRADDENAERAVPNLVGYGAAPRAAGRPQRRARHHAPAAATSTVLEDAPHDAIPTIAADDTITDRPRSTPPVRKLAKDLGVDLALVVAAGGATGVGGLITRADVEAFHAATTAVPASPPDSARSATLSSDAGETRIPIRGVRKATAAAMVRSAFTAPHVTTFLDVDVTETTRLVERVRADRRYAHSRIGVFAVVAKAACLALRAEPALNARWDESAGEIIQFGSVNLGIAAATERGLLVPNIPGAERLTLTDLAEAIAELATQARAGKATAASLTGGTFSLTNFGVFGIDSGTPILNPGESGILGVGAVRRRPWEYEGELALRDVLTLSLSFDHRVVDGQQAANFLVAVGDVLRDPGRALLLA